MECGNPNFPAHTSSSHACTRRANFSPRHRLLLELQSLAPRKWKLQAFLRMQPTGVEKHLRGLAPGACGRPNVACLQPTGLVGP
jgi:hypothetical protein